MVNSKLIFRIMFLSRASNVTTGGMNLLCMIYTKCMSHEVHVFVCVLTHLLLIDFGN